MTIPEAFTQLLQSPEYKALCKVVNMYHIKTRFKQNKLSPATMIELLEANGWVITASKAEKKKY